jgi:hypothetical protein
VDLIANLEAKFEIWLRIKLHGLEKSKLAIVKNDSKYEANNMQSLEVSSVCQSRYFQLTK